MEWPVLILLHNKGAHKQEVGSEFNRKKCEGPYRWLFLFFFMK